MDTQERWYSSEELIELAAGAGFDDVTRVKLAQWHRFGLLPKPRKKPLGQGKGSVSLYPAQTGPWLLDLLRIHKHERRLVYVAWRLWWAEWPVPMARVREFMTRIASKLDQEREAVGGLSEGERAAASARLHDKELQPGARPVLGRARQRLRGESSSLFGILMEAVSKPFEPDSEQLHILQKASGIARMRGTRPTSEPLPELDAAAAATVKAWTDAARQPLRPLLKSLSDEELLAARDAVRALFANLQGYVQLERELRGKGDITVTDWYPPEDAAQQVAFVLTWHGVRENARQNNDAVDPGSASAAAGDEVETYEMIRALRQSPTFSEFLSPSRLEEAVSDQASRDRFLRQLGLLISRNRDEAEVLLRRAGLMED